MSKPPRIAIVDDDDAVRQSLVDLLQVDGLAARTFVDGANLLTDASIDHFDCIVTDVRMAQVDGIELQKQFRMRGSTVPIIFVTSLVDNSIRDRALSDGAIAWFTKPVAYEALLQAVRAALQARRAD